MRKEANLTHECNGGDEPLQGGGFQDTGDQFGLEPERPGPGLCSSIYQLCDPRQITSPL